MDAADELRRARATMGWSQRELALRAGTSQAAVSAYEAGRKQPSVAVLARLLDAMGAQLQVVGAPGRRAGDGLERAGRRLAEVIALAEALPYCPGQELRFPRLPAAA